MYHKVIDSMHECETKRATIECRALLRCDVTAEEGKRHSDESDLHSTVCVECLRDSAGILE